MIMGEMMGNVIKLTEIMCRQQAAIRATINARAASLDICDKVRRRWVWKAITLLEEGASLDLAISEGVRGMTSEHLTSKV